MTCGFKNLKDLDQYVTLTCGFQNSLGLDKSYDDDLRISKFTRSIPVPVGYEQKLRHNPNKGTATVDTSRHPAIEQFGFTVLNFICSSLSSVISTPCEPFPHFTIV